MNKNFIIEQCRRLEVIHQEESDKLKEEELNNKWIFIHNDGHKKMMDYFVSFLKNADNIDKRVAKKWLKKAQKNLMILLKI